MPDLATECTVSEDGMTYTFKIREDAKSINGEPLTAHDFVFAWKRLADPAVAGAYAWMLDEVLSVKNAAEIPRASCRWMNWVSLRRTTIRLKCS